MWSPDEGRYVAGALQMLDSGNLLAPAYSPDRVNFSKPPLTYWVIAGSMKVFGRNTWAARTPYALAFLGTLLLLFAMGRLLIPRKPWLPALVYGCAVLPFFSANIISTDVLLTLFEALAMLGFLQAAFGGRHRSRALALMWGGFGLAFLTKGPPGLIPLLAILPFVFSRDGWRGVGRLFTLPGALIFFIVGFAWYVAAILSYPGLLHYFTHTEVYDRLFTGAQKRHPGDFGWAVVYVPALVVGSLPWWAALWRGVRATLTRGNLRHWRGLHTPAWFLLLWLLLPLIVFCLAQSRLPLYVLPLFLPLSLLLSLMLRRSVDLAVTRQRVLLALWLLLLLGIKAFAAYGLHTSNDNRKAARELEVVASAHRYASVIFVEDTALDYTIEQRTPWGLRLYLSKPIYGIAWRAGNANSTLCRAVRNHGSALLVIEPTVSAQAVAVALSGCSLPARQGVGSWRNHTLAWAGG